MKYLLLVVALVVGGCTTLPSPNDEKNADYGSYPDDYVTLTTDYLMAELRDPDTIVIQQILPPVKKWIGDKVTGIEYGYLVCAQVNSKDFFGDMTGLRYDAVLIRNGEVVDYVKDAELLSGMVLCD